MKDCEQRQQIYSPLSIYTAQKYQKYPWIEVGEKAKIIFTGQSEEYIGMFLGEFLCYFNKLLPVFYVQKLNRIVWDFECKWIPIKQLEYESKSHKEWHIGTCLLCGSEVLQMSDPELNNPDVDFKDYFIYCMNKSCIHSAGQRVYDDYLDTDLGWLKWTKRQEK